jgi:hypothetical protein
VQVLSGETQLQLRARLEGAMQHREVKTPVPNAQPSALAPRLWLGRRSRFGSGRYLHESIQSWKLPPRR